MLWRTVVITVSGLLLAVGTALVFQVVDASSHSVSDTLRPVVLTMAPVWLVAVLGAVAVLREGRRSRPRA